MIQAEQGSFLGNPAHVKWPHKKIPCSKGNITGGACERRRREPLAGSGGMLPPKILEARGLEMLFPAFSKSDM